MLDNGLNNQQEQFAEPPALQSRKKDKKTVKACIALAVAALLLVASLIAALFQFGGQEQTESAGAEGSEQSAYFAESSEISAESEEVSEEIYEESLELFPQIEAVLPENCQAAGIYEFGSLYCIFAENATEKRSLASITKLITASVALKYLSPEYEITAGSELDLVKPDSSVCGLQKGYKLTLEQLLYGLLMSSGNDAAYTVAVNVAREVSESELNDKEAVEYFCVLMNELAEEIGAVNSSFANPEGWDDENNYSTIADIALIARYAKEIELIAEISKTDHYTAVISSGEEMVFSNSNFMLHPESQFYNSAVTGLKTGSTSGAGKCLAATLEIDGFEYIAVVMGCPDEQSRYGAMKTLIEYIEEYHELKFS